MFAGRANTNDSQEKNDKSQGKTIATAGKSQKDKETFVASLRSKGSKRRRVGAESVLSVFKKIRVKSVASKNSFKFCGFCVRKKSCSKNLRILRETSPATNQRRQSVFGTDALIYLFNEKESEEPHLSHIRFVV